MGEIGITTVPAPPKVITKKKQRQAGQIVSSERGELVRMAMAIFASGSEVSPFLSSTRKNIKIL